MVAHPRAAHDDGPRPAGSAAKLRSGRRGDADAGGRLEIISRRAAPPRRRMSVMFVHGINVGGWVWDEGVLASMAEGGFDAHALSLRGHGGSWGRDGISQWTLSDYVDDLREACDDVEGPLVLVGHSLGGAVVQKYVQGGGRAAGMALLASVPPWGLAASSVRLALRSPSMLAALLELSSGRRPGADVSLLRRLLFTSDVTDTEIEDFAARAGPEARGIGAELQGWPPIAPLPVLAPPTLVIGGADDAIIPCDEVWRTALYYGSQVQIVADAGHMLMIGAGSEAVASRLKTWISDLGC